MIRTRLLSAVVLAGTALAACAAPEPDPAPPAPTSLSALEAAHDWQWESGKALDAAWRQGVAGLLGPMSRPAAIETITTAGFECIYGEAHQDYPDPMAVCTRSFATRRCQMDWVISTTADNGMVEDVGGEFRRDCVGVVDDWPRDLKSAIDDQQAPAQRPR